MTKREWKRRYMHERQLRKKIKWLKHELKRNMLREYSRSLEVYHNECFIMAYDYFTKPSPMTDEFKRVLIKWPSSYHNDLLADCND